MWWMSLALALTPTASWTPAGRVRVVVEDAAPNERLRLLLSTDGAGAGACPAALGGQCIGVIGGVRWIDRVADASGAAMWTFDPPTNGDTLWLQVVAPRSGVDAELADVLPLPLAPEVTAIDCAPTANALRFDCAVTLTRPARVDLELLDPSGAVLRAERTEDAVGDVTFTVYGMWPDDTFEVRARGQGGAWTTEPLVVGSLPAAVDLDLAVTGATAAGPFLFNMGCGGTDHLVVADGEGRVRWYQDVAALDAGAVVSRGVGLTPHGTLLVLVDRFAVAELGFDGELRWITPVDDPVHHEVLWHEGRVGVVDARAVTYPNGLTYVMDGVRWFDGATGAPLDGFSSEDLYDPQGLSNQVTNYWGALFPGAIDWAHTNALGVDGDGYGVLSLKAVDALAKVGGDPDAPDFGELQWTLTGKATSPLATDLQRISTTGVSPLTFGDQHHVTVLSDGDLLLFDNQPGPNQLSRVLRIAIDEVAGTADLQQSWPVGRRCPAQGSAVLLDDGSVIADCADADTLVQIAASGAELWSMAASCSNGANPPRPLYRALVVEAW